jgi:hypothetical protein
MSLPKINTPQYTLTLPSNGKQIIYRPFTVKEEKLLLIAVDDDVEAQIRALRQVINNCLLSGNLDVEKLPVFDIDYIWLKLRSKSVEEIVTIPFECRNKLPAGETIEDQEGNKRDYCGVTVNVPVNLDKIEVKRDPENNPKIELQDGIGIIMKYPTFEIFRTLNSVLESNDMDESFALIQSCVEMIYDGKGNTYEKEYMDNEELKTFLESLSQPQFTKIMKFFETLPVIRHEVHFKCPKCKHEADIIIEGTRSFLASDSAMNLLEI